MKKDKKTKTITFRVSDVEYMKIEGGAERFGMNISQYLNYLAHIEYMKFLDSRLLDRVSE